MSSGKVCKIELLKYINIKWLIFMMLQTKTK